MPFTVGKAKLLTEFGFMSWWAVPTLHAARLSVGWALPSKSGCEDCYSLRPTTDVSHNSETWPIGIADERMKEKHALIVDDSRSARLVLQRMLEKYSIRAHTVASAEDALDYLLRHRPDVIFMDHMMPGMDGFEAIKHIKKNLETATIPIIMFTSQSGELYLSQARALGAVDILPKATASTELHEALRRLGLLKKTAETIEATISDETSNNEKSVSRSIREFTSDLLRSNKVEKNDNILSELQEMRRYLVDQSDVLQQNVLSSFRLYSGKLNKSFSEKLDDKVQALMVRQPQPEKRSEFSLLLLIVLLCISLFWNYSLQDKITNIKSSSTQQTLSEEKLQSILDNWAAQQNTGIDADLPSKQKNWKLAEWAINQNLLFPYNELALGTQRLTQIRQLLKMAELAGFKGRIVLQTHVGEFCLKGNVEEGYQLAAANLPVDRCDKNMNPAQSSDLVSMQQSVEFANFLATAVTAYQGIKLEVSSLPRDQSLYEYPSPAANVTAGQWNRIAQLNNRIIATLIAE